ncbi:hypothetical protein [Corallococcus sp. CA053C]|uniref:hypothetical protein n=1 Tax=Corallococcus sp. CA053C TaxID=2316732 RepID=UPI0011C3C3DE|nr:hypothetical protein [Corallococcus sp. CA053C]
MLVTADDFKALDKLFNHESIALRISGARAVSILDKLISGIEPHLAITDPGGAVDWISSTEKLRSDLTAEMRGAASKSLEKVANLASKYWKPSGRHAQRPLTFIKNPELRRIAEDDWNRAISAAQREDAKTAAISAGSVVEAIALDVLEGISDVDADRLRDHLNSLPPAQRQTYSARKDSALKDWPLAFLILALGPDGMRALTNRTRDIGQQLRDFRNYVHPGKSRSQTLLSPADGRIAVGFAEKVIEEVEVWAPTRATTFPP